MQKGKTRVEHVREDLMSLTCKFERDLVALLDIADEMARRDLADDPLIKSIHDDARLGLDLEAPARKQAQLCKILNTVDKVMEMDFAQVDGQAIRSIIKPYQDKIADMQATLQALSLIGGDA